MRQMQKQMDEMQQKTNNQQSHQVKDGDYIDYEEVK
jgi:DNA-binding protein YbaB